MESGNTIITWAETSTWPKGTYSFTIVINTYVNDTLLYSTTIPITFKITIVGDINADGKVDLKDTFTLVPKLSAHTCASQTGTRTRI